MLLPPGVDPAVIERLPLAQKLELLALLEEKQRRLGQKAFFHLYPEKPSIWTGPEVCGGALSPGRIIHGRDGYRKHLEFFKAGARYRERCAMCANRVGKTFGMGGYEMSAHLTGLYPDWWEGRRFPGPIRAWAAGKTNETTRDIVQATLLGEVVSGTRKALSGTGIIPGDCIDMARITWKMGVADLVDTIRVKHVSGGWSLLGLKSYQQGRGSFEGTAQHVIWLDEEPDAAVYGECLIRTATTGGIVMITFTPLLGLSEVVLQFMPGDQRPD